MLSRVVEKERLSNYADNLLLFQCFEFQPRIRFPGIQCTTYQCEIALKGNSEFDVVAEKVPWARKTCLYMSKSNNKYCHC